MSEPIRGTKVTCPHCGRSGTAKISIAEGTRIKCPACGRVYEYRGGYNLQDPPDPAVQPETPQPNKPDLSGPDSLEPVPPMPRPSRMFGLLFCLRIPGRLAIGVGVLQFLVAVGGVLIGTLGAYRNAQTEQHRLQGERQKLKTEMTRLVEEMRQQIQKCDLRVEVPAPIMDQPHAQPLPQVQPVKKTCMEEYEERKEQYEFLSREWKQLEERLRAVDVAFSTAVWSALAWCTTSSAMLPLGIAYLAWVLGLVMICSGCVWLALVRRIFLTSPGCYLES